MKDISQSVKIVDLKCAFLGGRECENEGDGGGYILLGSERRMYKQIYLTQVFMWVNKR